MGSTVESEEQPVHGVTMPSFEMTETEVTVTQYGECVTASVCTEPDVDGYCNWNDPGYEDHPVNCVDWQQALDFCVWAGGRLPSESEWEYAARSGGQDITYPWGDTTPTCAYAMMNDGGGTGCGTSHTCAVCDKTAGNTSQGLCDMAGNVLEWTQDFYHVTYTGAPTDGSAWDDSGSYRVFRGGSIHNEADDLRAAKRSNSHSIFQFDGLGIRCAR